MAQNHSSLSLTTKSSLNIYKTTIMPYIDYGDIFYQAAFKGSLAKIQDRQTKALKICFKLHGNQDENDLHARANLAILEKRRNSHIFNFMYKRKENPVYLDQKIYKPEHTKHLNLLFQISI